MKIYAPVKDANGVYASVRFVNGVGETDNPRLIEWFRNHGYRVPLEDSNLVIGLKNDVVEVENDQIEIADIGKVNHENECVETNKISDKPDFEKMTSYELRDWMVEHGYTVRNTRSKEKLLEMLKG